MKITYFPTNRPWKSSERAPFFRGNRPRQALINRGLCNASENLGIFALETLHISLKTRTMRRLLGPARVKACLPLIDIYTEM
jgi:hypothetical protein